MLKWTNSNISNVLYELLVLWWNTILQVLEMILMLKWTNSNISNAFHELLDNFSWAGLILLLLTNLKYHGARVGDDFVANLKNHVVFQWLLIINIRIDA